MCFSDCLTTFCPLRHTNTLIRNDRKLICMYMNMYMHRYMCMYMYTCICIFIYTCICICMYMCICICICICLCICICICMYSLRLILHRKREPPFAGFTQWMLSIFVRVTTLAVSQLYNWHLLVWIHKYTNCGVCMKCTECDRLDIKIKRITSQRIILASEREGCVWQIKSGFGSWFMDLSQYSVWCHLVNYLD